MDGTIIRGDDSNRFRRALRRVGWNLAFIVAGLALVALVAEAWLRSTVPFRTSHRPTVFVPGVGVLMAPDAEIRWTNGLDFWTVSRTNRLGFLDREPPSPARAAEGCHIAMIGDSFVEAKEVPIADKFHVRLEETAARELPALDVTTSAFGYKGTGQINQLPYYDEFARRLSPRLVVLVFVNNDFRNNSQDLTLLRRGPWAREVPDPDHYPHVSAAKDERGTIYLRPPDPDFRQYSGHPPSFRTPPGSWAEVEDRIVRVSYLADSLSAKWMRLHGYLNYRAAMADLRMVDPAFVAWAEFLAGQPRYASLLDGWRPTTLSRLDGMFAFAETELPPAFEEALEYTAFALDRFKERTERDGASLAILATYSMVEFGDRSLHRLNAMAEARDIPVIDQYDYILRQGGSIADAHFTNDPHWNPTGHRWAAEALLEYLKRNESCPGSGAP